VAGLARFGLALPRRVQFGRGCADDAVGAAAGHGTQVLLVRGRAVPWADTLAIRLREAGCTVTPVYSAGEPDLPQLEVALAAGRQAAAQVVLAVGGGAVLDLGKAVAALIPGHRPPLDHLEVVGRGLPLDAPPLPFIAVPTTAGTGAEATRNAVIGVPDQGRKVSLRDDRMLADLALVDPALTDGCPRAVTLASGLDAVTQVIEPYLSCRANPLTDALCRDAIPRGLAALACLMAAEDPAARDGMALTSLTGGIALANAGLGAVHGLAGVTGGRHGAPHGAICGRLLVPVLRTNRDALAQAGADTARYEEIAGWIAGAVGGPPARAFDTLEARIDDWGLPRLDAMIGAGADRAVLAREAQASSSMKANPVPLPAAALAAVLEAAR
jgi:hypothetical protein